MLEFWLITLGDPKIKKWLGEVVEYADTDKLFSTPQDQRTEDYITGRFG